MRAWLSSALIVLVGGIHLLPATGVVSASRLRVLYGVDVVDANLLILMRHRAVGFGIVAGLLFAAAFHRPLRPVGIAVALVSMLSFVLIAWLAGDTNDALRRVVAVDIAAALALVCAALLDMGGPERGSE